MIDTAPLKAELMAAIAASETLDQLEAVRLKALGKKGQISSQLKALGSLAPNERRQAGQALNIVKEEIGLALAERQSVIRRAELLDKLAGETIDVSLPAREMTIGRTHPLSRTIEEISAIFSDMGFSIAEGPDIETDFYNFTALNIPPEHPARQEHDTFYLNSDETGARPVLRTHTSPVQIRTMLNMPPPIRIIVPGRTYRSDHDSTHSPMFHQCEGLVIGDLIHMGHLKGCLIDFCRAFLVCRICRSVSDPAFSVY